MPLPHIGYRVESILSLLSSFFLLLIYLTQLPIYRFTSRRKWNTVKAQLLIINGIILLFLLLRSIDPNCMFDVWSQQTMLAWKMCVTSWLMTAAALITFVSIRSIHSMLQKKPFPHWMAKVCISLGIIFHILMTIDSIAIGIEYPLETSSLQLIYLLCVLRDIILDVTACMIMCGAGYALLSMNLTLKEYVRTLAEHEQDALKRVKASQENRARVADASIMMMPLTTQQEIGVASATKMTTQQQHPLGSPSSKGATSTTMNSILPSDSQHHLPPQQSPSPPPLYPQQQQPPFRPSILQIIVPPSSPPLIARQITTTTTATAGVQHPPLILPPSPPALSSPQQRQHNRQLTFQFILPTTSPRRTPTFHRTTSSVHTNSAIPMTRIIDLQAAVAKLSKVVGVISIVLSVSVLITFLHFRSYSQGMYNLSDYIEMDRDTYNFTRTALPQIFQHVSVMLSLWYGYVPISVWTNSQRPFWQTLWTGVSEREDREEDGGMIGMIGGMMPAASPRANTRGSIISVGGVIGGSTTNPLSSPLAARSPRGSMLPFRPPHQLPPLLPTSSPRHHKPPSFMTVNTAAAAVAGSAIVPTAASPRHDSTSEVAQMLALARDAQQAQQQDDSQHNNESPVWSNV